ncbi:MAG: class I tRNA ligase family protein, partial [Candidatus Micrarchaeota archaeon]|nr:class I tRNA ligase family protein [Candidatus Micrarchaeota archaeon]
SVATADFASVLDFRRADVENSRKSLNKLYAALENAVELSKQNGGENTSLTEWIISKFESCLKQCTESLEKFELRNYAQTAVFAMLNDWEYFLKRASEAEKITASKHITEKWILLLTPLIPHSCEELNEKLGNKTYVSLSHWPKVEEKLIKPESEEREDYIKSVVDDVRKIKEMVQRKQIKVTKCRLIVASDAKWKEMFAGLKKETLEEATASLVSESLKKHLERHFYALQEKKVKKADEFTALTSAKGFLEKDLMLSITIEREEKSISEKKERAVPLKPSIVLE